MGKCIFMYAPSKGLYQLVHPCSLVRGFAILSLHVDSTKTKQVLACISSQTGLSLCSSQICRGNFQVIWPICLYGYQKDKTKKKKKSLSQSYDIIVTLPRGAQVV